MVTRATNSQSNFLASASVMRWSIGRSSRSSVAMRAISLRSSSCAVRGSATDRSMVKLRAGLGAGWQLQRRAEHAGDGHEALLLRLAEEARLAEGPAGH